MYGPALRLSALGQVLHNEGEVDERGGGSGFFSFEGDVIDILRVDSAVDFADCDGDRLRSGFTPGKCRRAGEVVGLFDGRRLFRGLPGVAYHRG